MPSIGIKINRAPKLGAPRFTRSEMRSIGEAVRIETQAAFRRGEKPDGSAAAPLTRGYAISKSKKTGRRALRDWNFKTDLPGSLRTTVSNAALAIIKFPAAAVRLAIRREIQDEMFSLGEKAAAAGADVARKYLQKALSRAIQ